jgi:hypothetical protein
MPLLMLWGHGSFHTSYGYFKVPADVEVQFFVPDNTNFDNDAIRCFEGGNLAQGVTDNLIAMAQGVQPEVRRIVKTTGDEVKNYRLESILGDPFASGKKYALRQANVWTPGLEDNNQNADAYLARIVFGNAHLGAPGAPMVIQWCACTRHYVGEDESDAPVARGKKVKDPNRSRCYITTAACTALGLGDDCEPLNKLRWFRDHVVRNGSRGARDVREYYATAPAIVRAIEREDDPAAVYRAIYRHHLRPALAAIDRAEYASAYRRYRRLVVLLRRRYLGRSPG